MKKRELCMLAMCLILAVFLTACSNNAFKQAEAQTAEDTEEIQTAEDAAEISAQEYRIDSTSAADSADSDTDYEIDDMLPRPSDDTFIMSVEDALELMNKNADGTEAAADEQQ